MSFIRHRRATSPNKFECRNVYSTNRIDVRIECELIDYEPEFIRKDYSISPFKNMHPKVIIKSALRIPDKIKRNSKFQTFREENTVCSKQCLSEGDFKNICNSFDEIVVGSDQVWNYNLTEHDMHYFLLEEAVNTLCRIHKDLGQFTTELKDVKGAGLERAAKYLKDVVGISGFKADTIKILLKRELYSYSVADGPTASRDFCGWETVFFSSTNGWRQVPCPGREPAKRPQTLQRNSSVIL